MPSNQIDVSVSIDTPQADVEALKKLTEALKSIPGAQGGGGGSIKQQFGTSAEAGQYLQEQAAAAKSVGSKLSGASLKATEGGGFEASAKVDEGQKKAFSAGGMIAGMGTAVGAIGAGFKQLLGMSKIFQTFMGTTGKILGTAVDLMLAPMMPFFMRIMVWLIMTVFPIATKLGTFLGGLGDKTLAAGLVGGFVALKLGPTLLSKAGESLGKHFVEKMGVKTIGQGISKALGNATETLGQWYTKIGKGISSALTTASSTLSAWYTKIGKGLSSAMTTASSTLSGWYTKIGKGISSAMTTASSTLSTWYTKIGKGLSSAMTTASSTLSTWYTKIGKGISSAMTTASSTLSTWYTKIGKGLSSAMTTASSTLSTWYTKIGKGISSAMTTASSTLSTWYTKIGKGISGAMTTASSTLSTWYTKIGKGISSAMTTASSTLSTWYTKIGKGISSAMTTASSTLSTWYTKIGKGISAAMTTASSTLSAWYTKIGKGISTAASSVSGAAGSLWKSVGGAISGGIGKALTWTKNAGSAIGDAIGGAMKKGKQLWSGLGSVGGMIGIGIGAVAIGATIGFMIWKEYDKYQKGKDITKDLTKLEQVRMLQAEYGVGEQQAVMIQQGMEAGGVSTSRQGMTDYMAMSKDMADQIRLFGTYSEKSLANMERQEQLLFADMMEKGMYGESEHFKGMTQMIRGGMRDGESIGSAEETLAQAQTMTAKERRKAAEAEIEAQAWYAMSIGGKHFNFLDMGAKALISTATGGLSRLPGGGWLTDKVTANLGFGTAGGNVQKDEDKVRRALGKLYGTDSFKGDMSAEQINIGSWLSAYQGDAASSFLPEDVAKDILGGKYQDEEIRRMSGSVINIMINSESLEFLSPAEKARLMEMVPQVLESGVVQSS